MLEGSEPVRQAPGHPRSVGRSHTAVGVWAETRMLEGAAVEILDQKRAGRTMRMYSAEQRAKAVETFARFGCGAADTIAELGYPSRATLRNWWREYQIGGDEFLAREHRRPRYSDEEKRGAVDHYLEHGKSLARTIRAMGYPSREVLASWVDELAPGRRKYRGPNPKKGVLPIETKAQAVAELEAGAAAPPRSPAGTACPEARLTSGGGRSWGMMRGCPKRKALP